MNENIPSKCIGGSHETQINNKSVVKKIKNEAEIKKWKERYNIIYPFKIIWNERTMELYGKYRLSVNFLLGYNLFKYSKRKDGTYTLLEKMDLITVLYLSK